MPVEIVIRDVLTSIITGVVILGVAFSPIGRAFAHRIMHGRPPKPGELAADPRVDELSGEVAALREQVEIAQDRLDFTERLLAQAREHGQLGAGGR